MGDELRIGLITFRDTLATLSDIGFNFDTT